MTTAVTIDVAGGQTGGAGRYRAEVLDYIRRTSHDDIKVIGTRHHLSAAWLAAREMAAVRRSRRIALNNVGFFAPGGERWTLLANALHFPTSAETAGLDPARRSRMAREAVVVHQAARRSDVLIAPCTAMAERVATVLPDVKNRLVVRMHPLSPIPVPRSVGGSVILCPVIFASYKHMPERLTEWLTAVDGTLDESVRMLVTASASEVPASLAASPRFDFVGRLGNADMGTLWARSRAVFFPPGLEAFGYALAEARVSGRPVIAQDTPQNREIAGPALCGYTIGDRESLLHATETALTAEPHPDAAPFDPGAYFEWMLGPEK